MSSRASSRPSTSRSTSAEQPAPAAAGTFPAEGRGSLATFGRRLGAFLIDAVVADIVSIVVLQGWKAGTEQNLAVLGAFLLIELLFVSIALQTPGMRVAGIAVVRYPDGGRQNFWWILARTLMLLTLELPLVPGSDGRPLHDRAAGTMQIQVR